MQKPTLSWLATDPFNAIIRQLLNLSFDDVRVHVLSAFIAALPAARQAAHKTARTKAANAELCDLAPCLPRSMVPQSFCRTANWSGFLRPIVSCMLFVPIAALPAAQQAARKVAHGKAAITERCGHAS